MSLPSALVKSVLKVARGAESFHSTTALKSAIRSDVESIMDGYGSMDKLKQGLTEYAAYGGKIPSSKTIGTQPSNRGALFILGVDDVAERLSWGVNAASDYARVAKGTITNLLPKGTTTIPTGAGTSRAGGGAIRARVMKLARDQENAVKVRAFPDSRPPGLKRIQDDLEFLRTNKPAARPAPSYRGLSDKNKSDIKGVVKAVKTKDAATKSAAIAKRRAINKNMQNRK